MNKYDFDYNYSVRDTIVRSIINVAIFAGVCISAWIALIGIDRIMGFLGII